MKVHSLINKKAPWSFVGWGAQLKGLQSMITTYSGISIPPEGLLAEQYMNNLEYQEPVSTDTNIQEIPQEHEQVVVVDSFAFPSQPIMLRLLALFTGKPQRVPETLLLQNKSLNSDSDNQRVADFVSSILGKTVVSSTYGENNELIHETEQIAIISNNPLVDGTAKIPGDLFSDDLNKREEKLALYMQKSFGTEGLRHFLGLVIGLDEHGRKGEYRFTVNEHLDRLGYSRSKNGSYDPAIKSKALHIIQVLSSLHLTISSKKGDREKVSCLKLFSLERYDIERKTESNELIHMNFILRATDAWYGQAFRKTDERSQQYTQLLKKIAAEDHWKHSLAIHLTPQLAIRWRMNKFKTISLRVSTIMELCGLDHSTVNKNRMRELRDLESELSYMVEAGYLGQWNNKERGLPSKHSQPFNCVLELVPPTWLENTMKKKVKHTEKTVSTIPPEALIWIMEHASCSKTDLADEFDVSWQHICNILNGRARISPKLSKKITKICGEILEFEKCQLNPALFEVKPCLH